MKTAAQWNNWFENAPATQSEMTWIQDTMDLIKDYAELEKLAIGGEGSTHFYWKDHAQALEKDLALNASMFAKQCDLAREAESSRAPAPVSAVRTGYCERHPTVAIVNHEMVCGAPQCCPVCCKEAEAEAKAGEAPAGFVEGVREVGLWRRLVGKCVAVLQRYIVPGGISAQKAIEELLGLLDGPEYRAALTSSARETAGAGLRDRLLDNKKLREDLRKAFGLTNMDYEGMCYHIEDALTAERREGESKHE